MKNPAIAFAATIVLVLQMPASFAVSDSEARHLLHRIGFGVTVSEWSEIINLDYDKAVDRIVDQAMISRTTAPPAWVHDKPIWTVNSKGMDATQKRDMRIKKREMINQLSGWWIEQMLTTESPLHERMTLFWSNHFTTGFMKIRAPMLIYQQHQLFREHGLHRFDKLLYQIVRNPAMIAYLDNDKNNKNNVNENLARELMELFTLGEGNYTEQDVKEAARCLTGWGLEKSTGSFRLRPRQHDDGVKTLLGSRGRYDGDDLVRLLLERPETAQLVVTKLWLEFISDQPDRQMVNQWAEQLSKHQYQIGPLLKSMFKSDAFRNADNAGGLIKSPVELYAGLVRPALDGLPLAQKLARIQNSRAAKRLPQLAAAAGQKLFDPPNVKGWPGGLRWIDSKTLLMREQAARNLVLGLSKDEQRENPYTRELQLNSYHADLQDSASVMWYLTAIRPVFDISSGRNKQRTLLEIVGDPAIHVK